MDIDPVLERRSFVKDIRQLLRILDQADSMGGVLIYSLMNRCLLDVMQRETPRSHLEIIDLLGLLVERLAQALYFTLRHDDGHKTETLGLADVVVLGVSRVSKTPTSLYLFCNYRPKVANVPIVQGV